MAMQPCAKCLENIWTFETVEDIVRASCRYCGHEVEFDARKQPKAKLGEACRKCSGEIVVKKAKKARTYSAYFYCLECGTIYYDQQFLIEAVDKPPSTD